jgi:DNA-binding protein H-NS
MAAKTYADLQKQIAKLQTQAERMRKGSFDKAIGQIRELMEKNGISITDLTEALATKGKKVRKPAKAAGNKGPAQPKYQSPSDPSVTWSGLGRKPKWVQEWIDTGNDLEKLLLR